jgi:branched-chain amino acid transport system permease protein
LAIGLVATYQSSGVINFGHAGLGTYCAFAFYRFRETGDLMQPILGLPGRIHIFDTKPTAAAALFVSLALAALMGAVLAIVVFRPLRRSSPLARVVASLGLLLYFIAIIDLRFPAQGATGLTIRPLLPTTVVNAGSLRLPADRLWLAALAIVAAFVLWLVTQHTPFGLRTRAVAENERGANLLGISADRIAIANWIVAAVLSTGALILAAPVTRLNATSTSLLVVPAIAAALVARFTSVPIALVAGLAIGMAQSELQNLRLRWDWLPQVNLQQGVPVVVVLGVLALRGRGLPGRGDLAPVQLPSATLPRRAEWIVAGSAIVGILGMLVASSTWRTGIIVSAIGAITALSVIVATGFVGQISLATSAFAGIAAFSLVKFGDGLPFPLAPLLASLVAVVVGVAVGLPALRVRGMTLAMATLAGAIAVESLVFEWSWFTGGVEGTTVASPKIGGWDLGISAVGDAYPRRTFGVLTVVIAGLAVLMVTRLRRSTTARRWLAVRDNERAAAGLGMSVASIKLGAFAVSAFLAGLAGTLTAYQRQTLSVRSFDSFSAVAIIAFAYLAGIANPLGAVVAGVLAAGGVLTVALGQSASRYQFAVNGLLLVVAAIALPEGIAGRFSRPRKPLSVEIPSRP